MNCTLDKLHEHIQTAMGWTNSHLHQFEIDGVRHGDPELIHEGWEDEEPPVDSRRLKISKIVPPDGKRFSFDYECDVDKGGRLLSEPDFCPTSYHRGKIDFERTARVVRGLQSVVAALVSVNEEK